jgi:hypothetical protein
MRAGLRNLGATIGRKPERRDMVAFDLNDFDLVVDAWW